MKSLFNKAVTKLSIDMSNYNDVKETKKDEKLLSIINDSNIGKPESDIIKPNNESKEKRAVSNLQTSKERKVDSKTNDVPVQKTTTYGNQKLEYDTKSERIIKGTIFSDGQKFCYQVSSWKIKSRAENEVARLKRNGENAFIVEANVPSKGGLWYRVRIGYFNSLEETENYIKMR